METTELQKKFGNRTRVRVMGALLENDKLLLAAHNDIIADKLWWSLPGGGVLFEESMREALHREFKEETTLEIKANELTIVHEFIKNPLHAVEFIFSVKSEGNSIPSLGKDPEMKNQILHELRWFSIDEVKQIPQKEKHQVLFNDKSLTKLFDHKASGITPMLI